MSTLENAAAILSLFAQRQTNFSQPGISFSDVVAQLELPKSTASRLLKTLESQHWLKRDPHTRHYHIGSLLLKVAGFYLSTPLVESTAMAMRRLDHLSICTGYIAVLEGCEGRVMRALPGKHFMHVVTPVGALSPAAETSVGRALLARESDEQVRSHYAEGYRVQSPGSPQTLDALLKELARIRSRGWSLARNEILPGISSLATTVCNKHRSETVGLCLSYPSLSEGQPCAPEVLAALIAVSRTLGETLGDSYWEPIRQLPASAM
ncbi:IclR family transcriptional regulator [Pseudomonas sp. EggHat1]|uniref:IclR family transcriptional regulator n=1 Tax=Pseudomonas sp. EggHat1 TaxID=2761624 RepID=UPI001866601D|nr:IclR family transcriptional regulator [Pseudomonas sp. EggHat1]